MPSEGAPDQNRVRTAEITAALSLATDLGMGLPYEHGLHSTLVALRLAERLGVDAETAGCGVLRLSVVSHRMYNRRRECGGLFPEGARLDAVAVAAVLEAAGQHIQRLKRPAGLTEREAVVVVMLARGLQTKQIARALGISPKTADHHIQNAYAKIGMSTRPVATLFAMEHGLLAWGELPMSTFRS